MTAILQWTAWPMETPQVYGTFHFISVIAGTIAALLAAWLLRSPSDSRRFNRILAISGFILIAGEIYKQLMYYYVICDHHYYWWIIPFQLCSLPMYLCPLFLLKKTNTPKIHHMLCTFLLDFNMMGAIATFIDPSGIFHNYWTLTLHGVIWHLMLLFIGFFIIFSRTADLTPKGFLSTLPLFFLCCGIAELLNTLFHNYGSINLFYISPYELSNQLLFADIDRTLGRLPGICIYIAAMIAGAGLIHGVSTLYVRISDQRKRQCPTK